MSDHPPPPPPPGHGSGYPPRAYEPPKHPQSTTALVLGIVGIVACGVVAPFAWVIGGRAVREIDASPGTYGGRSEANAGRILGIVGSVLLALAVVGILLLVVLGLAVGGSSSSDDGFDGDYTSLAGTPAAHS